MPRHRPISHRRRALADHDLRGDEGLAPPAGAGPRDAQSPAAPQAGGQVTAQGSAALNEQRLVDGLMADAHRLVLRIVEPQAPSDLFRAPRRGPSSVLPGSVTAALPRHGRPVDRRPVRGDDRAGQTILHGLPQRRVDRQLGWLWAARRAVGVPLCGRRPVVQTAPTGSRVPPQFPGDGRCGPLQAAGDLPHAMPLGPQEGNLLPLREQQVPPRRRLRR